MTDIIVTYTSKIIGTFIVLISVLILRFLISIVIRKVGIKGDFNKKRTELVVRYITSGFIIIGIVAIILIWNVDIKELSLIFSSAFAVLGIALFAQWSILSNVTAGIILFFNFPFKIGDQIKVLDKDLDSEQVFLIEDIKSFHVHLRNKEGYLITYPNNLMIQKAIFLVERKSVDS